MANERVVRAIADFLERAHLPHIVLDPILRSSSGAELLDAAGTRLMVERLFPLAELVTPNLEEAAALVGMALADAAVRVRRRSCNRRITKRGGRCHAGGCGSAAWAGSCQCRGHRGAPGKSDRSAELHDRAGSRAGGLQGRPAEVDVHPRHGLRLCKLRSRAIWRMGGDCRRRCCSRRRMFRRRSRMRSRWDMERGRCTICIE